MHVVQPSCYCACGYEIGHSEIKLLRGKTQAALKDRYDFRGFNDALVLAGGVPLIVLDQAIDAHIAERGERSA